MEQWKHSRFWAITLFWNNMLNHQVQKRLTEQLSEAGLLDRNQDHEFIMRFSANLTEIHSIFYNIYHTQNKCNEWFSDLLKIIIKSYNDREEYLKASDRKKLAGDTWFTSHSITGMSLYVDRFCGTLRDLESKLDYFNELGVNLLHLMPLMESPDGESDGGYAVSDFRKVNARLGTMDDLRKLSRHLKDQNMYLMLDIVLNHTSNAHDWAIEAAKGNTRYQDFYYMFDGRDVPDAFEKHMPDIFPDSSPGSFTYDKTSGKWVMTVFNHYQWDLNYRNPEVFVTMLDTILFYANLGVDILRIDAPAFIWKQVGTSCQNLPEAHALLQLIKLCVEVAAPGMALLGEAIVAPKEIIRYFGAGRYWGRECDIAYNATHMALQWDALATGDTRVMLAAQEEISKKPIGTTWITYTRCHDDIGLGYEDWMIQAAGFNPKSHRTFLKNYYSGSFPGTPARGALFGVNPANDDARISGSLASLCGLEQALSLQDAVFIQVAVDKILLMQAHSIWMGGIPMLFYGDECGYINDYSYKEDAGKSYDNRWMHRPLIDWRKQDLRQVGRSVEHRIFSGTTKIIALRHRYEAISDKNNTIWLRPHNIHVTGYIRKHQDEKLICIFNFSSNQTSLTWYALKEMGFHEGNVLSDLWSGIDYSIGTDDQCLIFAPYQFMMLAGKKAIRA
jgi:amylosucrase